MCKQHIARGILVTWRRRIGIIHFLPNAHTVSNQLSHSASQLPRSDIASASDAGG